MLVSKSNKTINQPRRLFLSAVGACALFGNSIFPRSVDAKTVDNVPIIQPNKRDDSSFIQRAFEMKRLAVEYGDQAFGAAVVKDGIIIGQSWSRVVIDQDPTSHAEMAAIRDAARRLKDRDLSGSILYSSSRACPMCEAAAYWAGVEQMIYDQSALKAGPPKLCR